MPNTTSPSPTFESIDISVLTSVQGGCGKKQQCCNCAPQAIAIAAPAPAPAPVAPAPRGGDSVSTSVSVSYQ
jgi:hypothetical protein